MVLTRTVGERRAVVVNIADKSTAAITYDPGPLPLNPPVIDCLEKGSYLVLLLEPEFGVVDQREGKRALVAGLEVEVRRIEVGGVQVKVGAAFGAGIDGSHR